MESGEEAGPRHCPQRQRPLEPHDQGKAGKGWGTGMGWETDMERETGRRARAQGAWKQQEEGQRQDSHRLYQKVGRTAQQRRRNVRQDPARILVHPPSKNPHLAQKC